MFFRAPGRAGGIRFSSLIMASSRFDIYIKAASDGKSIGDCPFSQRVNMYARLKIPPEQFKIIPVDIINKSEEFLKLNPDGKVPVLVDKKNNKIIADSGEITAYIHENFPLPDLKQNYSGAAAQVTGGIFGKLAALLKNSDPSARPELKEALIGELKTCDEFLKSKDCQGNYLLCDDICELDCSVLPKLRHLQVAGKYFQDFDIPAECTALLGYIQRGEQTKAFKETCPPDEEIIKGWSRHSIMKMNYRL